MSRNLAINIVVVAAIIAALSVGLPAMGVVLPDIVVKLVWIGAVAYLLILFIGWVSSQKKQ